MDNSEITRPVLDISQLRNGRESKLDFRIEWRDVPEFFTGIKPVEPVILSGSIREVHGFYAMSLNAEFDYTAECSRCLKELKLHASLSTGKDVISKAEFNEDENDDYAVYEGNSIMLDDIADELMYLNLPSSVLCSEDCKGLCQRCGKNLNEGPCNCGKEIDPRMEIFRKYLNENEN